MGKGKHRPPRHSRRYYLNDEEQQDDDGAGRSSLPSSAFDICPLPTSPSVQEDFNEDTAGSDYVSRRPSKFHLYQLSVQSPKGDISYLLKFFLTYIGARSPVHLREDFCGTALICAEWLKGSIQRFATGLDLDSEALSWGLQNNFDKLGSDACTRVRLLHGNVLYPITAARPITLTSSSNSDKTAHHTMETKNMENTPSESPPEDMESHTWPGFDIVCAFNYSCCCLHKRTELVAYFRNVLESITDRGGIFAMDLYGGISSEGPLKLRRHYPDFTYIWEQEAFDVTNRMTKISLHFQLKNKQTLRHAFTYEWRLWTLPELRDCLQEAGFSSVHFWLRTMPYMGEEENDDLWNDDSKYEEVKSYHQGSAWNAYIVAVAPASP